jgi:WD40 repeat protein
MLEHQLPNETLSDVSNVFGNSDRMITQHRSGFIRYWTIDKREYVLKTEIDLKHIGFCKSIHCKEENILIAPKSSSDISIINHDDLTEIKCLTPHEEFKEINCMRFFKIHDKIFLIAGYLSGHLVLWDIEDNKILHYIQYEFPISTFDIDITTRRGFLGSLESVSIMHAFTIDIKKLELNKNEEKNIVYNPRHVERMYGISCIRIRPDLKIMMVGTYDGIVYVHSMKYLHKLTALRTHRNEITEITFSEEIIDGMKSKITAVSGGDKVSLWDIYYKWQN